jgi:type IV pilus biogenesis protein CpaD/CtpE
MRALVGVAAAALALGLAGCGSSDSDQVHAKVAQFEHAVATRDAKTVCDQVLAPSLVARFTQEGLSCERGVQIFLASVRDPTLSVGRITVNRNQASALVLAGARCQKLALAELFLVKTSGGWRIASESKEQSSRQSC